MVKYKVNKKWERNKILKCEVESETGHFIVLLGGKRKEKKHTEYYSYFDTWQEARAFLESQARRDMEYHDAQFKEYFRELTEIEALKPI